MQQGTLIFHFHSLREETVCLQSMIWCKLSAHRHEGIGSNVSAPSLKACKAQWQLETTRKKSGIYVTRTYFDEWQKKGVRCVRKKATAIQGSTPTHPNACAVWQPKYCTCMPFLYQTTHSKLCPEEPKLRMLDCFTFPFTVHVNGCIKWITTCFNNNGRIGRKSAAIHARKLGALMSSSLSSTQRRRTRLNVYSHWLWRLWINNTLNFTLPKISRKFLDICNYC